MPDQDDSTQKPRKHRVIHWNPEDEDSGEKKRSSNSKLIIAGIVVAAVVAGVFGASAFLGDAGRSERSGGNVALNGDGVAEPTFQEAFASRSKADLEMDTADRKLKDAQQMRVNHPTLTTKLIGLSREFLKGEELMKRNAYNRAYVQFVAVNSEIDEFTREVENKIAAQEMYDSFLIRVEELKKAKHLDPEAYDAAFAAASEGKQFLEIGSFTPARSKLDDATAKLQEVSDAINEYLRSNAAAGHRYIAQGEGEKAIDAFTNVLKLDPQNEDAIRQLERAKYAAEVFTRLTAATEKEEAGELESALTDFEQAFAIDDASAKAQQGASRVRRKIENRDFSKHLALAREADADLRYNDAIVNYEAALKIFPTRTDLADAILKAKQDKHQSDVVRMVTEAYAFEEKHAWGNAREIYTELVDMEPELKEAKDGLLRTGRMIRGILRYEKLLEVSLAEARAAEFQLAIRTFDKAMQAKPTYLELGDEAERLRKYLQLQSQPVEIKVVSDMATWVSIQGPTQEKPKKIKEESFRLLPGEYRVIGRKKGYEDVFFSLQVRAGIDQSPLTVICNDRRG